MNEPPPLPPTPAFSRFETVPYQAEGGFTPAGSALLLIASLATGIVLGIAAGFVSRWFWLVLIFPALIGAGVGAAGYVAIRVGKVRSTALGAVSGLLGGLLAMLSMHYMQYLEFESEMNDKLPAQARKELQELARKPIDVVERDPAIDPLVKRLLSDPTSRAAFAVRDFPSFMNFSAVVGVSLKRSHDIGRKDGGMNLGYIGSIIYWLVEVLIVAGIALGIQYVAAKEPFCSECQAWKESRPLGQVPEREAAALREGDLTAFAQPPAPESQSDAPVLVTASVCPHGQERCLVDIQLARLVPTKEGVTQTEIGHVTYPGEALPQLEVILFGRPAQGAVATREKPA